MKILRPFLALLTGILLFTGCSKKSDTIKIGLAGVMTGPDGQIGSSMFHGSEIAIDEWNERGGVLGKKIEPILRDDEGKPHQAVAVAQEIASQEAAAVIGHFNSGCTIPASEIYHQNKILQITPGSTNPKVTEQGFPHLFRIVGRDDQVATGACEYAMGKMGLKKFAILHNKTPYGVGIAEEFKKFVQAKGGEVVVFDGVAAEELDFRANISTFKNKGAEAVFWGGMYNQGGPLVVQMRQNGLQIPLFGGDGIMEKELIKTVGNFGTNIYIAFWPDHTKVPEAQPFLQKYRARFGEEGPYAVYGYDAANVILTAMQEAGTTDPVQVSAKLRAHSYKTLFGDIEFDAKGDLKKVHLLMWTVRDGKFVVIE